MTFKSRNTINFIQIQFSAKACQISTVQLRWHIVSHHILFQKRTDSRLRNIMDSSKVPSKHRLSLDLIQMIRMFTRKKIFSLKIIGIKLCIDRLHRNKVHPLESAADLVLRRNRFPQDITKALCYLSIINNDCGVWKQRTTTGNRDKNYWKMKNLSGPDLNESVCFLVIKFS